MKVLIIDDSSVARKTIALTVETLGYSVIEAKNGEEGLTMLSEQADQIALIMLDWNMPGMSGLEVLQEIRKAPASESIPVMMVTTEMERKNMVEAVKAGANHYLTKPFTPEDLSVRVLQCLGVA